MKQTICPSVTEWINKLLHPDSDSVLKNKLSSHEKGQGENLNTYYQVKETNLHMTLYICPHPNNVHQE